MVQSLPIMLFAGMICAVLVAKLPNADATMFAKSTSAKGDGMNLLSNSGFAPKNTPYFTVKAWANSGCSGSAFVENFQCNSGSCCGVLVSGVQFYVKGFCTSSSLSFESYTDSGCTSAAPGSQVTVSSSEWGTCQAENGESVIAKCFNVPSSSPSGSSPSSSSSSSSSVSTAKGTATVEAFLLPGCPSTADGVWSGKSGQCNPVRLKDGSIDGYCSMVSDCAKDGTVSLVCSGASNCAGSDTSTLQIESKNFKKCIGKSEFTSSNGYDDSFRLRVTCAGYSKGLSGGAVAGIVIGVLLGVALIGLVATDIYFRKSKGVSLYGHLRGAKKDNMEMTKA